MERPEREPGTEQRGDRLPGLPDDVRRRVLEVAAAVLGDLPADRVPASLTSVRRFAPARRASAGATPLAAALDRDDAFRAEVAAATRAAGPDLAAALAEGTVPPAADPADVAAAAYVLRDPGWTDVVHDAVARLERRSADSTAQSGERELTRLREELSRVTAQLRDQREQAAERAGVLEQELAAARRELRRHRSDADRARAESRTTSQAAQQATQEATRAVSDARTRAERAEAELARTKEALEALRRADREGRSLAGSRARLLLDTVVDAASGLRRELGLAPADVLPADLVGTGAAEAAPAGATPGARARDEDDPGRLAELLSLPRAHLVVDGYNVTKSAYGDLPLADQRARLVAGLSGLAARTRVEVTCCFDGAVVEGRVPVAAARGVRVRFSDPGQTADDLVRALVRAEPPGRVVVVVSSDREVADGVRASGAYPVPSAALVRLLTRG